ncbi:hypothetical protein [Planktosalinus lacus]|uniref:Uncharacterized protein n=1 Tax=Planktosalinus lacus TaxID=1526573 RepID=A0A8J2YC72_9FLAO|nr:hypothetical protein [Planktosalinus lacus]GGE00004.1 hypothetical protein GCM10011312_24350 [Planktosalinus lacus]
MRILIICLYLLISFNSFSQNREEIQADFEMQGYFKDYWKFDLDSLEKREFKYVRDINSIFGGFRFERDRDNGITELIYSIQIDYPVGKWMEYKEYQVHVFSKNDTIIGLINYDPFREKTNFYFDFEVLKKQIDFHNTYYKTNFTISDFVDQILDDRIYGYVCGYAPVVYDVPRYNELLFDDKKNISEFRHWIKSFNPELQTYGVDALEYLEKNKKVKLTESDKKIIRTIKKRNSTLNTCSGCLGVFEKANGE